MATYYISTNGTTWATFASAGIVDCAITYRASGVDELTFTVDPATWTAASAYATGTTLYFKQVVSGVSTPIFVGRVAKLPREATGAQHKLTYLVLGPWHRFEKITYGQEWTLRRSSDNAEVQLSKPRVVLGQNSAGAAITNGAQIAAVIDFLIARGVPILKGTIDAGIQMPYDEQRMLSAADAIRTCLRWSPDWVAWFDYSTLDAGIPKPTFHCQARSNLAAATIDLTSTTKPEDAAIEPRADLVVPGIRIVYEKTHSYDGNTWNSYDLDTAGDDTDAECVDLLFEMQGTSVTLLKQSIQVAAYPDPDVPAAVKAFFRLHIPWLADIADGDLDLTDVTTTGEEGYAYYITEGAVPDWLLDQIGVEEETISATCAYVRKDDSGNVLEDVEEKAISVKLLSTNASSSREYKTVGSIEYGETTPTGVAAALYASWSILHYEGTISLLQAAPDFGYLPGKKLNISNGLSAWATMAALIQDCTVNLATGLTSIRIGPPARLDADSLVALYRATHARAFSFSREQRTSSALAGAETAGPKNLARASSSEGDPGAKLRLRIENKDSGNRAQIIDLHPGGTTFETSGDAAALTLQVREALVPEVVGGSVVFKLRQILASTSYHTAVTLPAGVPNGSALGQILHWKASTSEWVVSEVGTLAAGDLLQWDATNGKWVKVTPVTTTIVTAAQYDSTNHQYQIKTRANAKLIAADAESAWTMITGGQLVLES